MADKEKILLVAPPFIPTSKDSVAGTEKSVYVLGRGLSELGYNVSTIAGEGSVVYGDLIEIPVTEVQKGVELENFYNKMSLTAMNVRRSIRENSDISFIIDCCQGLSLPVSVEENGPRVISRLNLDSKYFWDPAVFNYLRPELEKRNDQFVAVSDHVAQDFREKFLSGGLAQRLRTIHTGIDVDSFDYSDKPQDYVAFLGRMRRGKAPHLAIQAAKQAGHRIIIAGGSIELDGDAQYQDAEYVRTEIAPLLGDQVKSIGVVDHVQKVELLKNAKALLFSSVEPDALPLVPLEAMACGTPVVAFDFQRNGAVEEIVDKKTGYVVGDVDGMAEVISKVGDLNRADCRTHVENRFDFRKMIDEYARLIGGQ